MKPQQEDKACLLRLHMEPSAMFKPVITNMLQQVRHSGVRMVCMAGWMQVEIKGTRK